MQVFVVTSKAQEEDSVGTILSVKVKLHGVFTNEKMAKRIADKYRGEVSTTVEDAETSTTMQSWINPGYKK